MRQLFQESSADIPAGAMRKRVWPGTQTDHFLFLHGIRSSKDIPGMPAMRWKRIGGGIRVP
jgi:hypothetical protein